MNANLLRGAMAEQGVTQDRLAKAIGISRGTLNRKIKGERSFNTVEIVAICDYLKIADPSKRAQIFLS